LGEGIVRKLGAAGLGEGEPPLLLTR
jgi:hypothetical protein